MLQGTGKEVEASKKTHDAPDAAYDAWAYTGSNALAEHSAHPDGPAILPAGD